MMLSLTLLIISIPSTFLPPSSSLPCINQMDNLAMDVPGMLKQKDAAVKGLTGGIEGLFKKWKVGHVDGKRAGNSR